MDTMRESEIFGLGALVGRHTAFVPSPGRLTSLNVKLESTSKSPTRHSNTITFSMMTPDTEVAIPSRRYLMGRIGAICLPAVIAQHACVKSALAYASPYSQNPDADKKLPDRLYDKSQVVETPSGLRYFDLLIGDVEKPSATVGSFVACEYLTRLGGLNGVKLDSSSDEGGEFRFIVGDKNVVPGINEMVIGMHPGGKRRAVLSPAIGYVNADLLPAVKNFFARRRLLSVLNTNRDATIVVDIEMLRIK
jgi:hypothetical protein